MIDPWLGFVNEQVSQTTASGPGLEGARLRQTILDRSACSFPFPLEISFRGIVVDRVEHEGEPHLLVAPSRLRQEAVEVLGGILLPSDRQLRPASVVEVDCHLADPDAYWLDDGVLACRAALEAVVPIEP
ncbi:hypothetical protein BRD56_00940 [Thermoplasmatales archaeon SW_10_69_26]|nr:MAG: hypothetical protein BRD56_00940 [Thermoplasmatales archaeon SW_10_69_26]